MKFSFQPESAPGSLLLTITGKSEDEGKEEEKDKTFEQ